MVHGWRYPPAGGATLGGLATRRAGGPCAFLATADRHLHAACEGRGGRLHCLAHDDAAAGSPACHCGAGMAEVDQLGALCTAPRRVAGPESRSQRQAALVWRRESLRVRGCATARHVMQRPHVLGAITGNGEFFGGRAVFPVPRWPALPGGAVGLATQRPPPQPPLLGPPGPGGDDAWALGGGAGQC